MGLVYDLLQPLFDELLQPLKQLIKKKVAAAKIVQRRKYLPYIDQIIYYYENHQQISKTAGKETPLQEIVRRSDLFKYYVDLEARDCNARICLLGADFLRMWIESSDMNKLLILGDFGSGKTSLCVKFAYELARKFKENPRKSGIPLFISLKDLDMDSDIRANVLAYLRRNYSVNVQSLAEDIIYILDGFDEISSQPGTLDSVRIMKNLMQLSGSNGKILLTSRTHFFKEQNEINSLFTESGDSVHERFVRSEPHFQIYFLNEWNEEKVVEFLRKRTLHWEGIYQKIRSIYDLEDLARRPLLLEMIVLLASKLQNQQEINSAQLYKKYTDIWIEYDYAQHGDYRSKIRSVEQKENIMEELAFLMYLKGERQSIHSSELKRHINQIQQSEHLDRYLSIDEIDEDIRNCSFLNRDNEGYYKFIHKSFMEYFVARKLAREIPEGNGENLKKKQLSYEVLDFMKDMNMGDPKNLNGFVLATKDMMFDEVKYLGGNAASLMNKKQVNFVGLDFSNSVLRGANLSGANLRHASFRGADLTSANFNNSNLTNADFRNAICDLITVEEGKEIRSCLYTPDGKYIAFGLWDGSIEIMYADSFEIYGRLGGHSNSVTCIDVSRNGMFLVSGGYDSRIKLWDLARGKELFTYIGHDSLVRCISFDPVARKVISANKSGKIVFCEITEEQAIQTLWKVKLETGPIRCIQYHPTEKYFAVGEHDGSVRFFDEDGQTLKRLTGKGEGAVWGVSFSSEGSRLASCNWDRTILLWATDTGELIKKVYTHNEPLRCIEFHRSGRIFAVGDNKGGVFLVDIDSGEKILDFAGHQDTVYAVHFDPIGGNRLISSALDGAIKLWDVDTGVCLRSTPSHGDRFKCQGLKIGGARITEDEIDYLLERGAVL